jgi:hypothetical protein
MDKPIDMDGKCKFIEDLQSLENNDRNYNLGLWNLTLSIRDLKLYSKGIKPNRHWKISNVKKYFGMNGNAELLLLKLEKLNRVFHTKDKSE